MKKFKNHDLKIYKGDNQIEDSIAMISIFGRIAFISMSLCIIIIFFVYNETWDYFMVSLSRYTFGISIMKMFYIEMMITNYYEQIMIALHTPGADLTKAEYAIRALLEHRIVMKQNHMGDFSLRRQTYSSQGIRLVIWLAYMLLCFLHLCVLSYFDFMMRKPTQSRRLTVEEQFILSFVYGFLRRAMIVGVSLALAVSLSYIIDAWVNL